MKRFTVVTICLGNICRSPLMEALVARAWAAHAGRPPDVELVVVSAGLNPMLDYPTQEAVLVGRELGVDLSQHRSKQVTLEHASESALVLTATAAMKASLFGRFPDHAPGRTFSMGEYAGEATGDIEDPYGRTMARYRECAQQIQRYAEASVRRFADELRTRRNT